MTGKNKKVLLVEDDSAIIDIYTIMLNKAGFDVQNVTLGQDAINAVQNKDEAQPDVVLLDLILADMNGTDVLKAIRKDEATKHLKVFILTNQQELPDMGDVKPDKFIIKANITPTKLVEKIKEALS